MTEKKHRSTRELIKAADQTRLDRLSNFLGQGLPVHLQLYDRDLSTGQVLTAEVALTFQNGTWQVEITQEGGRSYPMVLHAQELIVAAAKQAGVTLESPNYVDQILPAENSKQLRFSFQIEPDARVYVQTHKQARSSHLDLTEMSRGYFNWLQEAESLAFPICTIIAYQDGNQNVETGEKLEKGEVVFFLSEGEDLRFRQQNAGRMNWPQQDQQEAAIESTL